MQSISVARARWAIVPAVLALWPAWVRHVEFGIVGFPAGMLLFVLLFFWWVWEQRHISSEVSGTGGFLVAAWGLLVVYAVSYSIAPPLGRQIIATLILASALLSAFPPDMALRRMGLLVLFPLTLPLEMALQFVVGYPFRRISAEIAGILLSSYGITVKGTTIPYGSHPLEVDAACSGVLGLWSFLIVGGILSLILKHRWSHILLTSGAAVVASLCYNVLRTSLLFMYRFHIGVESSFSHSLFGSIAFLLTITAFTIMVSRMSGPSMRSTERCSAV